MGIDTALKFIKVFSQTNSVSLSFLFIESSWKKKLKERERSDKNICLLRGRFLYNEVKINKIVHKILKVLWKLLCYWHTLTNLESKLLFREK